MNKKIGIIIVNWNSLRLGYAKDLVDSLNQVDYPTDQYTVFVGDNLSDDGSAEYIGQHLRNAVVVRNSENLGFSEGNNQLVDRCIQEGYDYVYLLNQDTYVQPDFLTKAVAQMESEESIGAVQSLLLLHDDVKTDKEKEVEGEIVNSIGNAIHFLGFGFSSGGYVPLSEFPRDTNNGKEIAYASGAAVLLDLKVIEKVKLFDTHFFMYHEDLDLGWKLKLAGYKTVLAYDSVVHHKYTYSASVQKYYYMERNRYIVLFENFKLGTLLVLSPLLLAFELGTLLFSFKSGFWREKIRVYPYFLKASSWKLIMQHRKEKRSFRVVKDADVFQNFTGAITNQHIDNFLLNRIVNPCMLFAYRVLNAIIIW